MGLRDVRPVLGGLATAVDVGDGTIAVECIGHAGPVLLLLHGWTLDRRMWTPQVAALAARFRVIAVDRRGCGQSGAPPDPAREVDDLAAVLDMLDAGPCAVVGMSQGARMALGLAERWPARVAAMVLHGPPLPLIGAGSAADVPLATLAALAATGAIETLREAWCAHPLMAVSGADATALRDAMLADYMGKDLLATAQPIAFASATLAAIATPTLVLTGKDDTPERARHGAELAVLLPDAVHRTVPGGHLCNLDNAETYNRVLLDFLSGHASGKWATGKWAMGKWVGRSGDAC